MQQTKRTIPEQPLSEFFFRVGDPIEIYFKNTYQAIALLRRWKSGYIAKRPSHKIRNTKIEPIFITNMFNSKPLSSKNSLSPLSSSIVVNLDIKAGYHFSVKKISL